MLRSACKNASTGVRMRQPWRRPTFADPSWIHPHRQEAPDGRGATLTYAALHVAGLDRSLACYRDRLGFEAEFAYEGFYGSAIRDGCRIHLKCAARDGREAAREAERIDVSIGVRHIHALAAGFAPARADIAVPRREMPYGRELYVRDPDGHILGFVEVPPAA